MERKLQRKMFETKNMLEQMDEGAVRVKKGTAAYIYL